MDPMTDKDFARLQLELMRCMEQATRDGWASFRREADRAGVWETISDFACSAARFIAEEPSS